MLAAIVFVVALAAVATYSYRRGHDDGFAAARAGMRQGRTLASLPHVD